MSLLVVFLLRGVRRQPRIRGDSFVLLLRVAYLDELQARGSERVYELAYRDGVRDEGDWVFVRVWRASGENREFVSVLRPPGDHVECVLPELSRSRGVVYLKPVECNFDDDDVPVSFGEVHSESRVALVVCVHATR